MIKHNLLKPKFTFKYCITVLWDNGTFSEIFELKIVSHVIPRHILDAIGANMTICDECIFKTEPNNPTYCPFCFINKKILWTKRGHYTPQNNNCPQPNGVIPVGDTASFRVGMEIDFVDSHGDIRRFPGITKQIITAIDDKNKTITITVENVT